MPLEIIIIIIVLRFPLAIGLLFRPIQRRGIYMLERLAGWMDPSGEYLDRGGLYTSNDFVDRWNFKLAADFWYNSIACNRQTFGCWISY